MPKTPAKGALNKKESKVKSSKPVVSDEDENEDEIVTLTETLKTIKKKNSFIEKELVSFGQETEARTNQTKFLRIKYYELLERTSDEEKTSIMIIVKHDRWDSLHDYVVSQINKKPSEDLHTIITRHQCRYPKSEIIIGVNYNPNQIDLWKVLKKKLKNNIKGWETRFNLKKEYSEAKLIKDIEEICDEL